jgi:formylglycine-generating enzyme
VRIMQVRTIVAGVAVLFLAVAGARADVFNLGGTLNPATGTWTGLASLQFVPIGNPRNAADTRNATPGYGAVDYGYNMGEFEVTAGQYTAFLNAVAATDTYGLYSPSMANPAFSVGCGIQRSGEEGSFVYTVAPDWANRPVNYVSWGDAARFANWLTNGQKKGAQDATTTEDGSYVLSGATSNADLLAVTRKPYAKYVLPTENEWYKAAYYDAGKPGGAGYWTYPTRSDTAPGNALDPSSTNSGNYDDDRGTGNGSWGVGSPYYTNEVGAYALSPSAYGTFDQGGNVWELNETAISDAMRGTRGGSFGSDHDSLDAQLRSSGFGYPGEDQIGYVGFRIAEVPEPATLTLLALGGAAMLRRRLGRRGARG